jgi:hypothetical protein
MASAIVASIVVVFAVFWLRRRPVAVSRPVQARTAAPGTAGTGRAARVNRYRAISIAAGVDACPQAAGLAGRRFLVGEVPQLPLQGCPSQSCSCRYLHHEDRRGEDAERRAPAALSTELYASAGNAERRGRRRGRRITDWE